MWLPNPANVVLLAKIVWLAALEGLSRAWTPGLQCWNIYTPKRRENLPEITIFCIALLLMQWRDALHVCQ